MESRCWPTVNHLKNAPSPKEYTTEKYITEEYITEEYITEEYPRDQCQCNVNAHAHECQTSNNKTTHMQPIETKVSPKA